MTWKVDERIQETTATTGTGAYALDGAAVGFQAFSVLGNGVLTSYVVTDDVNWEVGVGTVSTAPAQLARTTILASSNGGAAVNWGSGTKKVMCTLPAKLASGRLQTMRVYSTPGTPTWSRPYGCAYVIVEVYAAGGGGGGVGTANGLKTGGGGGQGGYAKKYIADPGATETVTVGSGGTAGANTGGNGGTGGTSSFGSHCSATGGAGGQGTNSVNTATAGGAGGTGSNGDIVIRGAPGGIGHGSVSASGSGGGSGGGIPIYASAAGSAGVAAGGGSGALDNATTGRAGGVGGDGYVVVWEYA